MNWGVSQRQAFSQQYQVKSVCAPHTQTMSKGCSTGPGLYNLSFFHISSIMPQEAYLFSGILEGRLFREGGLLVRETTSR